MTVRLELPSGAEPASLPPSASVEGNTIVCNLGSLDAGASRELSMGIKLGSAGENTLRMQCADDSDNTASAVAITQVQAIADLTLLVNDPIAPAPTNSEVIYELELTNRGSKAAENVRVIAQFSDGIEPSRADGPQYKIVPGQLFFDPIARVAAGQTIVLKVYATASASGMHRFRAEVRTDDADMRLVQEEATQFLEQTRRVASPMATGVVR